MSIHPTLRSTDPKAAIAFRDGVIMLGTRAGQPYGSREFAVADPEGNPWSVGSHRPTRADRR